MEALPLDPDQYSGTYKLIGGRISLDFVNTLAWSGTDRVHDWFDQWTNVIAWSVATGVHTQSAADRITVRYKIDPESAVTALAVVKQRRQILSRVLSPLADGGKPEIRHLEELNEALTATCGARRIDPDGLGWTWLASTELEDLTAPVLLDAASLITDADHTRLGVCPACKWLFYDSSRNRSRRWCDMADCGSRKKSIDYYYRQRKQT